VYYEWDICKITARSTTILVDPLQLALARLAALAPKSSKDRYAMFWFFQFFLLDKLKSVSLG